MVHRACSCLVIFEAFAKCFVVNAPARELSARLTDDTRVHTVHNVDRSRSACTWLAGLTIYTFKLGGGSEASGQRIRLRLNLFGIVPRFDGLFREEPDVQRPGSVWHRGNHDTGDPVHMNKLLHLITAEDQTYVTFPLNVARFPPWKSAFPASSRKCRESCGCCQAHSNWSAASLEGKPCTIMCMIHGRLCFVFHAPWEISPLCSWLGVSRDSGYSQTDAHV
jgi:hypothetical protein